MSKTGVNVLKIVSLLTIIAICIVMLSFSNTDSKLKTVISNRIDVLNSYYKGENSFEVVKNELKKIETGLLFDRDIEAMERNRNSEVKIVLDYIIDDIEVNHDGYNNYYGKCNIYWLMDGSEDMESHTYAYVLKNYGNDFKLTKLDIT